MSRGAPAEVPLPCVPCCPAVGPYHSTRHALDSHQSPVRGTGNVMSNASALEDLTVPTENHGPPAGCRALTSVPRGRETPAMTVRDIYLDFFAVGCTGSERVIETCRDAATHSGKLAKAGVVGSQDPRPANLNPAEEPSFKLRLVVGCSFDGNGEDLARGTASQ
jgi:hypothetical protein